MKSTVLGAVLAVSIMFFTVAADAASLDKVQFIRVSNQESKVVIKGADGKMAVVKPEEIQA